MPKTKKKKPSNGRAKLFDTIFIISDFFLIIFLWILKEIFQISIGELVAFYLIGTLAMIMVLRAIDRNAADRVIDIPSRP